MGAHKFVTQGLSYQTTTFCEWCGLIIMQANDNKLSVKNRWELWTKSINCPNTPPTPPQPRAERKDEA